MSGEARQHASYQLRAIAVGEGAQPECETANRKRIPGGQPAAEPELQFKLRIGRRRPGPCHLQRDHYDLEHECDQDAQPD